MSCFRMSAFGGGVSKIGQQIPAQGRCEIQLLGSFLGDTGVKFVQRQAFAPGDFRQSLPGQVVEADARPMAINDTLAKHERATRLR